MNDLNIFRNVELRKTSNENEYTMIIKLDHYAEEFANELGASEHKKENVITSVKKYLQEKYPKLKVTTIKVMMGGMVLTTIPLAAGFSSIFAAKPVSAANVAISEVSPAIMLNGKRLNTNAILINGSTFIPIRAVSESLGAKVGWDQATKKVSIQGSNVTISFVVNSSAATVNGVTKQTPPSRLRAGTTYVPIRFVSENLGLEVGWDNITKTVFLDSKTTTHIVERGDTLWKVANAYGISVQALKQANHLTTDTIHAGQTLTIPAVDNVTAHTASAKPTPSTSTAGTSVSYKNYSIQPGDNMWNLSMKFGIPYLELLKVNKMTEKSALQVGQIVKIPEYHIPVKETVSAQHGELLDWWTEARYVFSTGKIATITDFQTGRSFKVKHTMGGNHADSEPLTAKDAQIMKEIWGGTYSWTPRAIIVEVDGRKLAAAMHSFPHGESTIQNNNYNGHFCIHFQNSQRHKDGQVQESMQKQVRIAAGVQAT